MHVMFQCECFIIKQENHTRTSTLLLELLEKFRTALDISLRASFRLNLHRCKGAITCIPLVSFHGFV